VELHKDRGDGPICFIVEDGDDILVPRAADNMSAITALLNFGDGIIGALLDVKVIVTTNAKSVEMDSAILRRGRLSARVEVGPLSPDKATEVFRRLNGEDAPEITNKMILAEVYGVARDAGWVPAETERSVGFKVDGKQRGMSDSLLEGMEYL
jgi:SpoVK/Ycf46/Vps4 family AAA+-type ATPase